MDAAFQRYRIMSFITGTTLLLLFVLLGLQHELSHHVWTSYGFSIATRVVGIGHGVVLYPVYMVLCFNLAIKAKLHIAILLSMLLSGFLPFQAFSTEYMLKRMLEAQGVIK